MAEAMTRNDNSGTKLNPHRYPNSEPLFLYCKLMLEDIKGAWLEDIKGAWLEDDPNDPFRC